MFNDNNLILFLLCIIPVVFYSFFIFYNSPSFSIRLKASFTYLYTGLLSVTLLQFIHFIFPHLHDMFFQMDMVPGQGIDALQPTVGSLVLFAFIQVALFEEVSKWLAFKFSNYMRGRRRKNLDHPYATMFYSSLVAAAFSIVENIQYAQRAMSGEFGIIEPSDVLTIRAVTSVIVHMACGLFMGYYIGLAKSSGKAKKYIYNFIGIIYATVIHGIYDFNLMRKNTPEDFFYIFNTEIHIPSVVIICFSLISCYLMSCQLKLRDKTNLL